MHKRDTSQCFTQDVVTAQRALDVKVTFETVLMRDANHVYLEEYGKVSLNYSCVERATGIILRYRP